MAEQLPKARRKVVGEYDGLLISQSWDEGGQHGFTVRVDRNTFLLVGKSYRVSRDGVSFSRPVVEKALRNMYWLLLYADDADELYVFDPRDVPEVGVREVLRSKKMRVEVFDLATKHAVTLDEFIRNKRPGDRDRTKGTSLKQWMGDE